MQAHDRIGNREESVNHVITAKARPMPRVALPMESTTSAPPAARRSASPAARDALRSAVRNAAPHLSKTVST